MKLSYQKDGVIQLSLKEEGVSIPISVNFLQEFITVLGGTLTLPAEHVSTFQSPSLVKVYLSPSSTPHKIQFIKDLRQVFNEVLRSTDPNAGPAIALKEAKEFVESAMAGGTPWLRQHDGLHQPVHLGR